MGLHRVLKESLKRALIQEDAAFARLLKEAPQHLDKVSRGLKLPVYETLSYECMRP